jgi:hypothetical protein
MPVDTMQEMERTPLSSAESLRVRCPHCRKLYLVQFTDIREAKPRFECVQCRTRFWLSLGDVDLSQELVGLPLQQREAPLKKTEPCPKCFKPVEAGRSDCGACGVVLEKARSTPNFIENMPPHSANLETLWKKVIGNYAEPALHNDFIRACQRERNLAYAGAQYALLIKLMPSDEITQKRLGEIKALGSSLMPSVARGKPQLKSPAYFRMWHFPLMAAVIVIIVGMVLPMFRNLVGLGAMLLFLAMALRIQFRKN